MLNETIFNLHYSRPFACCRLFEQLNISGPINRTRIDKSATPKN